MPKILSPVPDTMESTLRPIVTDVIRQVFANTRINENTQIFFPGDLERGQQMGGSINPEQDESKKFAFNAQMKVTVNEQYVNENMLSNTAFRPENIFLFRDDRLSTGIRPVYADTEVTLTFSYRARDKTEATRWRDDIRTRTSTNREHFIHDITYHFLLPPAQLKILQEIHRMREKQAGYGESWEQYFAENRTNRITFLTNQAGAEGRWAVRETQTRVQGWFDFEGVPELGSKGDDADTWTISFDYKFRYNKAIHCSMVYPLVVHNQMLDQKYRPGKAEMPPKTEANLQKSFSFSGLAFHQFEAGEQQYPMAQLPGVAIPDFDEFFPADIIPGTMRVFTGLVGLTEGDKRSLVNLNEIGGAVQFPPELQCCFAKEWPFMTKPFQSIFLVSLYKGPSLMEDRFVTVDEQLNVLATQDLDLREVYHVRFALYRNWRKINPAALKRLQWCAPCLIKVLTAIDPSLPDKGFFDCVVDGQFFPDRCLDAAIDEINKGIISKGNGQINVRPTVETLSVRAHPPVRK